MPLVTSSRMYNACPRAASAWKSLFERVFDDAGLDIEIIEHGWPQPIDALWSEPGLCGAFMCGWPFTRSAVSMQAIAVPVPSPARYAGLPRYCSDFVARQESGWSSLEESFGHRIGWMAENSQSGFNAPRAHLARLVGPERKSLYRESIGPLGAPAKTLEALLAGVVDVVALDGFWLDLLRRHEPARLEGARVVASTPWTPIPLIVAAPGVDRGTVERLRSHLTSLHARPGYRGLLADTLLERFVEADLEAYEVLEGMARGAEDGGYANIR